jgi:hypothetical protein
LLTATKIVNIPIEKPVAVQTPVVEEETSAPEESTQVVEESVVEEPIPEIAEEIVSEPVTNMDTETDYKIPEEVIMNNEPMMYPPIDDDIVPEEQVTTPIVSEPPVMEPEEVAVTPIEENIEEDEPLPTFEPVTPDITEMSANEESSNPSGDLPAIEIPSIAEEEAVIPQINEEITTEQPISIENSNIPIAEAANEDIVVEQPAEVEEQPIFPIAEPSVDEYNYSPVDVTPTIPSMETSEVDNMFKSFQGEQDNKTVVPDTTEIPNINEISTEPINIDESNIPNNA